MQSPAMALETAAFIAGVPDTIIVRMHGGRGVSSTPMAPPLASVSAGAASRKPEDPATPAPPAPPVPTDPAVPPLPGAPPLPVVPRRLAPGGFVMTPSPHAATTTASSAMAPMDWHFPPPLKERFLGKALISRPLQTALFGIPSGLQKVDIFKRRSQGRSPL